MQPRTTIGSISEHSPVNNYHQTQDFTQANASVHLGDPTFQTSVSPDEVMYRNTEVVFKNFITDLPSFVATKLTEHEKQLKHQIEIYMNDIEKFKLDKEQHARNLKRIRDEFDVRYALEETRQTNKQYREGEERLKKSLEEHQTEIELKLQEIEKKKELVKKYLQIVKTRAKRNVRLTAIANKLQYEIEKRKAERKSEVEVSPSKAKPASKAAESSHKLPKIKPEASHSKGASSKAVAVVRKNPNMSRSGVTHNASEGHTAKQSSLAFARVKVSLDQKEIQELTRKINRVFLKDMDIFNLFRDCLTSYFSYVKKTQQITQQRGLEGSLLFEIMQKSSQGKIGYPHLGETSKPVRVSSTLQDRHIISVVYESMKEDKDKEKRRGLGHYRDRDIKIKWEEMQSFNPLQVMGLLVMQWDVLNDILNEWENFLNKKSRLLRNKKPGAQ